MPLARACLALARAGLIAVIWAPVAAAQRTITLIVPTLPLANGTPSDSTSPAPVISFTTEGAGGTQVQVQVALEPTFRAPIATENFPTGSGQMILDSLLPARTRVYYRARAFDESGNAPAEANVNRPVRSWVRLVSPLGRPGVLFSARPTFTWSSPPITFPPGPWEYSLTIFNRGQNRLEREYTKLSDTTFTLPIAIDACTSYSWAVKARAVNGAADDVVDVESGTTFVIQSSECPKATISYQNFPNPFGRGTLSDKTCFWFDLAHSTTVKLTIYDIRLNEAKRLVPGLLPAQLDSGAYGRQSSEQGGCDPRLLWDGTDDAGRKVPPGVYIAVFEADGRRETKKILYRGP